MLSGLLIGNQQLFCSAKTRRGAFGQFFHGVGRSFDDFTGGEFVAGVHA